MAYLPENEADRQRRMQAEQNGGPQVASGSSGVITGGAQGGPSQSAAPKGPAKSGAFTNLNAYLGANQEQATDLGQRVATNVSNQAEQAKTQLGTLDNTFKQQADQNSVKRNSTLVSEAINDPTKFVQDQNKLNTFTQMRDAQYKGPSGIQDVADYGTTQQAVKNASTAVDNTKSEAGRFSLVQNQFKQPSYSRGQQRLDQLLLQNSTGARQALEGLQGQYSGLNSMLDQRTQDAQSYAQNAKAETEAARKDVQSALGQMDDPTTPQNEATGALGNFQTDLNARTAAAKTQGQAQFEAIQRALGSKGDLSADEATLAALGLKEGQHLYDIDLSGIGATFNPDNINAQTVANDDDYAKYAALSRLAGTDNSYLGNKSMARSAGAVQLDQNALQQRLGNAQARYDQLMTDKANADAAIRYVVDNSGYIDDRSLATRGTTPEEIRAALAEMRTKAQDKLGQAWIDDALDPTRTSTTGGIGQSFRTLNDWLSAYDKMNPNRTVKKG